MDAEKPKATLYDFAYVDIERTRSLVAQLFDGYKSLVQKHKIERSKNNTTGKLSAGVVSGQHALETEAEEGDTRLLDPHDLLHLDLVSALRSKGYLRENSSSYSVGDIILVSGQLSLINYDIIAPLLKAAATDNQAQQKPAKLTKQQKRMLSVESRKADEADDNELSNEQVVQILTDIVPMTVQLYLKSDDDIFWGVINVDNSREPISNIALKYGPVFPGKWYLLALVDVVDNEEQDISFLSEFSQGIAGSSQGMRPLFGRPDDCIGVTPLLLFRELTK